MDPTTSERQYSEAEMEFMMAMNEYETAQWKNVSYVERGSRGASGIGIRKGVSR